MTELSVILNCVIVPPKKSFLLKPVSVPNLEHFIIYERQRIHVIPMKNAHPVRIITKKMRKVHTLFLFILFLHLKFRNARNKSLRVTIGREVENYIWGNYVCMTYLYSHISNFE